MKIVAHRGDTTSCPENTISAFKAALERGADAIELDVQATSDGQLVVHHDYYLGNPDNGSGLIFERDAHYIQNLTIDGNEKIPMLKEVFEYLDRKLHYEVELKGMDEKSITTLVRMVNDYDLADYIEFTSSTPTALTKLKSLDLSLKTGIFTPPTPEWMGKDLAQKLILDAAVSGNMQVIHCPVGLLDTPFIELVHNQGLWVHAADCDTEEDLRIAFSLNVDQLSTNNLAAAVQRNLSL